jgi:hypothetical protein
VATAAAAVEYSDAAEAAVDAAEARANAAEQRLAGLDALMSAAGYERATTKTTARATTTALATTAANGDDKQTAAARPKIPKTLLCNACGAGSYNAIGMGAHRRRCKAKPPGGVGGVANGAGVAGLGLGLGGGGGGGGGEGLALVVYAPNGNAGEGASAGAGAGVAVGARKRVARDANLETQGGAQARKRQRK